MVRQVEWILYGSDTRSVLSKNKVTLGEWILCGSDESDTQVPLVEE